MSEAGVLVEVAVPLPIDQLFTYRLEGKAVPSPGTRVLVPFRRRERVGWIVGRGDGEGLSRILPVLDVIEKEPSVPGELFRLCLWAAEYYVAPLGLTLRAAVPSVLTDASRDYLSLGGTLEAGGRGGIDGAGETPRERRLLRALAERSGPCRVRTLARSLEMGSLWPEIRRLEERGLVRHETVAPREPQAKTRKVVRIDTWLSDLAGRDEIFGRAHRQREAYELLESRGGSAELAELTGAGGFSRSVVTGLEEKGIVSVADEEVIRDPFARLPAEPPRRLEPTPAQDRVLERLVAAVDEEAPSPFLLHGVTGSGKTLVYIELLKEVVLARGRGAIVLVPEISLTPQTVARFRAHFGDEVAVLHSGLSQGERYDAWRQLRAGERRIAVGARSALFAPVADLGAIVVDEEHEGSYKQSETPRYHARDLAVMRGSFAGAVVVLGSATPSLESWANADQGKFELLSLPERVGGGELPPVRIVDLREVRRRMRGGERRGEEGGGGGVEEGAERREVGPAGGESSEVRGGGPGGSTVLSPELVRSARARIGRGEQVILLLNRRGYSSFIQCRGCGDVRTCRHCSVSLTYHRLRDLLICHHCGHEEPTPERCPTCGDDDLSYRGLGTEQVERIVAETFPGARIARMDVDTTSGKWSHHEILGRVERGEVEILLGTQMIAKGLDFPGVTLVGVINADVGLHLPDFRATERTFQLLSQVSGRAGRGRRKGEVIIQTSVPDHYAVVEATKHAYTSFAERELSERREPAYPPHVRLANVVVSSPDPEVAARGAEEGARWIRIRLKAWGSGTPEVVGPAPSPIERLHGRWRWHFLLRSPSPRALGRACRALAREFEPPGGDVRLIVDRDPTALL